MAFPFQLLVQLGKAVVQIVRETSVRRKPPKHWYPRQFVDGAHPEHTCYYCGRFDQLETEVTNPPCDARLVRRATL